VRRACSRLGAHPQQYSTSERQAQSNEKVINDKVINDKVINEKVINDKVINDKASLHLRAS